MSSGLSYWGLLGVGEEGSIDDVGESAFEEAEGLSFGGTVGESSGDECLGVGMHPHLGDRDAV